MGTRTEFHHLARDLMREHGLGGWAFEWTPRAKNRAGVCRHSKHTLGFAPWVVEWSTKEQRLLILHEIAHALAGARAGHGVVWRRECYELGIPARRCYDNQNEDTPAPKGRYVLVCDKHGERGRFHRYPSTLRTCGACSRKWNPLFIPRLIDTQTGREDPRWARKRYAETHEVVALKRALSFETGA